jgi:hypothetical protein
MSLPNQNIFGGFNNPFNPTFPENPFTPINRLNLTTTLIQPNTFTSFDTKVNTNNHSNPYNHLNKFSKIYILCKNKIPLKAYEKKSDINLFGYNSVEYNIIEIPFIKSTDFPIFYDKHNIVKEYNNDNIE